MKKLPEWKAILNKTEGHCAYCGRELTKGDWHKDHLIPRSEGGRRSIKNLVPACARCNIRKYSMNPEEFREYLREQILRKLSKFIPDIYEHCLFTQRKESDNIQILYQELLETISNSKIVFAYEDVLVIPDN